MGVGRGGERNKSVSFRFRFADCQIFRFSTSDFSENIFGENMLVRYRGINNKGVLERPRTKWKVLRAISTTLKCKFTENVEKWTFRCHVRPNRAKICCVSSYGPCGHPGHLQTSPISTWILKKSVFVKNPILPIRFLPENRPFWRRLPMKGPKKGARRKGTKGRDHIH